jgi:trk system potassium uptake protein TrkH
VYSRLKGLEEVNLWGRRLPYDAVRRAGMVLSMAVAWNVLGILVLAVSESHTPGFRFEHIIFEQISAFGTVGLSANVTPTLSDVGKVWIMATMFIGRVGPLTAAFAILQAPRMPRFQYPVERVMIG